MDGGSDWRDIGHLQHREMEIPLSPPSFRHDVARYVHPSRLAALSPMLDDHTIVEQLSRHDRIAPDLSRLIIDHFALDAADDVDVEQDGRRLILTFGQDGARRLLLIGACCFVYQIRQVIDGPRVGWLMNVLSRPGYLGALRFGRSSQAVLHGSFGEALADCQSQSALERILDKAARRTFQHWLSMQQQAFRQRVTMMFPKGVDFATSSADAEEAGLPLADIMEAVADIDLAAAENEQRSA